MAEDLERRLDDMLNTPRSEPGEAFIAGVRRRRRGRRVAGAGGILVVVAVMAVSWPRPAPVEGPSIRADAEAAAPTLATLNARSRAGELPSGGGSHGGEEPIRAGSREALASPEAFINSL